MRKETSAAIRLDGRSLGNAKNRTRAYSERRDTQNERLECSSIKCVHKLALITLASSTVK